MNLIDLFFYFTRCLNVEKNTFKNMHYLKKKAMLNH